MARQRPSRTRRSRGANGYVPAETYTSAAMSVVPDGFARADLEFQGVDHSGASFEARVFLNNPDASVTTPKSLGSGYAGSFYIFGHGGCFGDVGHCDIQGPRRPYDPRPSHPLTPARKVVIATEAIRAALKTSTQITVTIVPVVTSATARCDVIHVLHLDRVAVITYR